MHEFNWTGHARWVSKKEWKAEPHDEDCECAFCMAQKAECGEMMNPPDYDDQGD